MQAAQKQFVGCDSEAYRTTLVCRLAAAQYAALMRPTCSLRGLHAKVRHAAVRFGSPVTGV